MFKCDVCGREGLTTISIVGGISQCYMCMTSQKNVSLTTSNSSYMNIDPEIKAQLNRIETYLERIDGKLLRKWGLF